MALARYDNIVLDGQARPVPGASIAVLGQPSNTDSAPGSPLVDLFSDPAGQNALDNPFQPDGLGNYYFYADAGTYDIQIYGDVLETQVLADQTIGGQALSRISPAASPLVVGDFQLSGWGDGATLVVNSGTDTGFSITVTAGTTPTPAPYIILTWHDGPWASVPTSIALCTNVTNGTTTDIQTVPDTSTLELDFTDTPQEGATYTIGVVNIGPSNLVSGSAGPLNPVLQNPTGPQVISLQSLTLATSAALTVNSGAVFAGSAIFTGSTSLVGPLTASNVAFTAATPTATPGQVALGNSTDTTATAGGGQAVPGTVLGYLTINVGGTIAKIPYFAA